MDDTQLDTLVARNPLDGHAGAFAAVSNSVTQIRSLPLARHLNLRLAADEVHLVATELGQALPTRACTFSSSEVASVVWLGPDEWLVIDTSTDPATRGGPGLEERLRRVLAGTRAAIVDQSGQRVSVLVTGDAAGLLAKGTAIDMHPDAFPDGSALQSHLAQTIVVLLARERGAIEILVRSSFARYLADWLVDAASDPAAND
ncbi:hypothetical protein GY21_13470 [Cryobacterium roopkundense]|nr:sarcosine oxidase subunit gamma family protein [Cryobacterium roopkundense]KGJ72714.1 hypothetical protein GY21_13470 [Cryobacterium roopkundense]